MAPVGFYIGPMCPWTPTLSYLLGSLWVPIMSLEWANGSLPYEALGRVSWLLPWLPNIRLIVWMGLKSLLGGGTRLSSHLTVQAGIVPCHHRGYCAECHPANYFSPSHTIRFHLPWSPSTKVFAPTPMYPQKVLYYAKLPNPPRKRSNSPDGIQAPHNLTLVYPAGLSQTVF